MTYPSPKIADAVIRAKVDICKDVSATKTIVPEPPQPKRSLRDKIVETFEAVVLSAFLGGAAFAVGGWFAVGFLAAFLVVAGAALLIKKAAA